MPRDPMASGNRAPVDSPSTTNGMPRSTAARFMCATFLLLVAAVDAAESGDLAVGLRFIRLLGVHTRRSEETRLDERILVDQIRDALARVPRARRGALRVLVLAAARERFGAARFVFLEQCFV